MLASRLAVALALAFSFALAACNSGPTPPTPTDVAAPPASAETSASGLAWRVLTPGTGTAHPSRSSTVTVHYSGWTTDGKLFDSSVKRGQPASFPLNGVIKGWTEGVQLMKEGSKFRFFIPPNLAYGTRGAPPDIAPNETLVFEVELLKVWED
ncbi:MAG: FKBP-type peptidyl-prolyl cis-trans isomerase [Verrucomicrobiales bacterium]|nr:FKBP-type peptidyl-prolyl cis-trans isomerase [Verrucomicrobiales bacterium]